MSAITQPKTLAQYVLVLMRPLVQWLVKGGVGYTEFATLLKPLFLEAAQQELQRTQQKINDSRLSLLSGLHRKDVRALGDSNNQTNAVTVRATPLQQVIARWLSNEWPLELPFSGAAQSFEQLAWSVSRDFHPRALANELLRQQVIRCDLTPGSEMLCLSHQAFMPPRDSLEALQLASNSIADHISATAHNLSSDSSRQFLEQAVFADGLSAQSAHQLELLASQLWQQAMKKMIAAATPLCEQDAADATNTHRVRLGMFCYATDAAPGNATTHPPATATPTVAPTSFDA